jgi:hypothetical protein
MLIASNYMLNLTTKKEEFELYPFIHNLSNNFTENQPFRMVKVPDIFPAEFLTADTDFSMVAGEFVDVYTKQPSMGVGCDRCRDVGLCHHVLFHRHSEQRASIHRNNS